MNTNNRAIPFILRRLLELTPIILLIALLVLLVILYPARVALASNITVTASSSDVLDANGGNCSTMTIDDLSNDNPNGAISLREAICAANNAAGADTINIPAGIYQISITPDASTDDNADGDLDITSEITLQGAGKTTTFIQAGTDASNGIDRLLHVVNSNASLTLEGLTIRYGRASVNGGGIYNEGTLSLSNTMVISNTAVAQDAVGGKGGGIYNLGSASITGSTIQGNDSTNQGSGVVNPGNLSGGGLYNDGGTFTVTTSLITSNTASHTGGGIYSTGGDLNISATQIVTNSADGTGGIYIQGGSADIQSSTISGNWSNSFNSGGIYNQGNTTLANSTITNNQADGSGGGIYNEGTITITGGTISGNSANSSGGGIYNNAGTATISTSTVNANSANSSGGGICGSGSGGVISVSSSTINENTAGGGGGGIFSQGGALHILASTISGNQATGSSSGGGIGNVYNTVNIANSTISGNTAAGYGGGIYNIGGALNATNDTFARNSAATSGGGIYNYQGTVNVSNTIITNSTNGGDCGAYEGTISGSNNLIDDNSSGACSGISSAAVDGFETVLYDNGPSPTTGPTLRTHALLPGSNAIDGVPDGSCKYVSGPSNPLFNNGDDITDDQRSEGRPTDYDQDSSSLCDVGAFERQADETYTFDVGDGDAVRFGATMTNIQDVAGGNSPGNTTIIRYNQPPGGGTPGAGEMPFQVAITPTIGSSLNINLTLCYTDWEVSNAGTGVAESNLVLFRNTGGSSWTEVGYDSRDTTNNCVTKNNVNALSSWTLGQGGSNPTAITLQKFSARTGVDATIPGDTSFLVVMLALGAVAVLAGGGVLLRRRRRA